MTPEAAAHWPHISSYLATLGYPPAAILACEVLQEGISGADTYRLRTAAGDAVLKVTARRKGRLATERAGRELAFYRKLAGQVPLRTPRLLAGADDAAGHAILLAAYTPPLPLPDWPASDYIETATQIARLHAAYWDQTDRLARFPWLRRRQPADDATDIAQAHTYWQTLQAQPAFAAVLPAPEVARIQRLVANLDAARQALDGLPLTLCHGDCNPWNVLRDADGALVWTDWQEVGLGRGPEDLAFFLERAIVAGGQVPLDDALAAYHASLTQEIGADVSLAASRRVVAAAELWSRACYWPAYLTAAPPDQLAAMLARIYYLAGRLGVGA